MGRLALMGGLGVILVNAVAGIDPAGLAHNQGFRAPTDIPTVNTGAPCETGEHCQ